MSGGRQKRQRWRHVIRDNVESVARDHLANERTFLAWVRTGLAFVGLGVVMAEFIDTEGNRALIGGVLLIGFGTLVLGYATTRYRFITTLLDQGKFRSATWGPLILGALSLLVAVGALAVVMT